MATPETPAVSPPESPAVPPESRDSHKEPPRDEEGLLLHYDVVLCGTGLVSSILASALARAGKSVLHTDPADHYGQLDAVWTFEDFKKFTKQQQETVNDHHQNDHQNDNVIPVSHHLMGESSFQVHNVNDTQDYRIMKLDCLLSTPYGVGKVVSMPTSQHLVLTLALIHWTLNGESLKKHPLVHVGIPETVLLEQEFALEDYLYKTQKVETVAAQRARLILQSRSLALDVSPTCLLAAGPAVSGLLQSGVADYLEFKPVEGLLTLSRNEKGDSLLQRVPCHKNDVFAASHMTPMDKRRLMKFLQTALDHATAQQEEEEQHDVVVQTLNERHLNQGRSLARPQNKAVHTEQHSTILRECMANGMTMKEFLQSKQRLSPALAALVQYAMALDLESSNSNDMSLEEGMRQLSQHMLALGRFGTTAFLAPLYGSGELPQAFCRSAAVHGATYLLRRAVVGLWTDHENGIEAVELVSTDAADPAVPLKKRIRCSHVVVPSQALLNTTKTTTRRVLRRISILQGKPFSESPNHNMQPQRYVVIFPPNTVGNESAIQGILLDESVKVAPLVPGGCTIVHLTTVCEADACDRGVLQRALALFLQKCQNASEIFGATFSYPHRAKEESPAPSVLVVNRPAPGIAVDHAFEQAARLYAQICPRQEFLALSQAMTETIQQALGEQQQEPDDEELVLESAMGLIQKQQEQQQQHVDK